MLTQRKYIIGLRNHNAMSDNVNTYTCERYGDYIIENIFQMIYACRYEQIYRFHAF